MAYGRRTVFLTKFVNCLAYRGHPIGPAWTSCPRHRLILLTEYSNQLVSSNGSQLLNILFLLETGYRGFHQYLTDPSPSEIKYQAAVQNLKTANHQYAKRQVSWIRNKLLPAIRASKSSEGTGGVEMYLLDATGPYFRLRGNYQ